MSIEYKKDVDISVAQFVDLLERSGLAERRPVEDIECLQGMLENSNLTCSAWESGQLVGIARSMTDFHYACYLSDLAVCRAHQQQGIGKQLLAITQASLGPRCKIILVAAPDANQYYEPLGFVNNNRCWVLEPNTSIIP